MFSFPPLPLQHPYSPCFWNWPVPTTAVRCSEKYSIPTDFVPPGGWVDRKHKCPVVFEEKATRSGPAFTRFKRILLRTLRRLGCRRNTSGEDYSIKQQGIHSPISGLLCCGFITLIIASQPQYNAVGEWKFWQNKTKKTPIPCINHQTKP